MENDTVSSKFVMTGWDGRWFMLATLFALAVLYPSGLLQAETIWTPFVNGYAAHNDNILFVNENEEDDVIYSVQPGIKYDYNQEITKFTAEVLGSFRMYQENDDLNDESFRANLRGNTNITERLALQGRYRFVKDTTLDSELEEIGRVSQRDDRYDHDARLYPSYNFTERLNIGLSGGYRDVSYDAPDQVNYTRYSVGLPIRWRLETQIDTIYITPEYTNRESDTNLSDTYSFRIGWDHQSTERLVVNLSAGARYTEHEKVSSLTTEDNWGALGNLKFTYALERGRFIIDFQKDLQNTANGDQADVNRMIMRLKWNLTERLGMEFNGRYYYTVTEGQEDDDETELIQGGSEIFYNLTEHHVVLIAYQYSTENQDVRVSRNGVVVKEEQRSERNKVWAGIKLNFPF